jgi:glucose-1-phosphate thymidylyltransferase
MRAIIPVAGSGSRLRPHTYTLPKVLLNVAGKPILGHILDHIIRDGFTEATIIVGYLGDQVCDYVRSHYDIRVDFVEQEERKGLAHAIHIARHTISSEPILIILGDTIFDVDLKPVIAGPSTSIGVKLVKDPRRFGIAEMVDGVVTKLVEKPEHPTSNHAIVGLYWIARPQLLLGAIDAIMREDLRTKGEYQLTDALDRMRREGERVTTFMVEGWYDCGKPDTLLATNRHLLDGRNATPSPPGVVIIPPVFIDPTAKISYSVIGPYATIAAGVQVEDSIIRNSIVGEEARVNRALLENSIVGTNAYVAGSFKRINIGDSSEIDFLS